MVERNAGVPPEKRIDFASAFILATSSRRADGDLMGDGVNIAARLEGICEPGGDLPFGGRLSQVQRRLEQVRRSRRDTTQEHRRAGAGLFASSRNRRSEAFRDGRRRKARAGAFARRGRLSPPRSLVALLAAGAYGWRAGLAPRFLGVSVEDKLANAPRLSIVVLPFQNLSGDNEQDYFADGMTDDLTTDLSHLDGSFVIARNTAFTYKGKPVDAKQIGRELGVRYVLEGSVRRVGENITVNAQLISTETGAHVWADRFEGERSKLGELQVEFVSRLANSLGVELVKAESLRAMRERPNNPDADRSRDARRSVTEFKRQVEAGRRDEPVRTRACS